MFLFVSYNDRVDAATRSYVAALSRGRGGGVSKPVRSVFFQIAEDDDTIVLYCCFLHMSSRMTRDTGNGVFEKIGSTILFRGRPLLLCI